MDTLGERSLLALEKAAEIQRQQQEVDQQIGGQSTRTYQGYDADKGSVIMGAAGGSTVQAAEQGSLSNATIREGKAIRSYGDQAVDWPLTLGVIGGTPLRNDPKSYEEQKQQNNPDDVPDGIPGLDDPLENDSPYCSCLNVWTRGTPDKPDEPQEDPSLCTFSGGQCVGDEYEVYISLNGGPDVLHEFIDPQASLIQIQGPIDRINESSSGGFFDYELLVGNGSKVLGTNFTSPQNFVIESVVNLTNGSDPCGDHPACSPTPEATGPPAETDPSAWYATKSCAPPVGYTIEETDLAQYVVVIDSTGVIARLGYVLGDNIDVQIRCSEEGPP